MRRLKTHPSVKLAWYMANIEAYLSDSPQIEPVHFFSAILRIIDNDFHEDATKIGFSPDTISQLTAMISEARELIGLPQGQVGRLRRSVCELQRTDEDMKPTKTLHRSELTKELFNGGVDIAAEEQASSLTFLHLLKAIMLQPLQEVSRFLEFKDSQRPELLWETTINRFVEKFKQTRLALVMTDMEGSMSIKRRYGDQESAKIFRAHDKLLCKHLAECKEARVIDAVGDSMLLAFSSEVDAVLFALIVQSSLRTHTYLSQIPIKVRIGIYSGQILSRDILQSRDSSRPIFGITIDTTSRITSLARGNQILTDNRVFKKASGEISAHPPPELEQLEWRSYGQYFLKGLDNPIEIFEVGEVGKAEFIKPRDSRKASSSPFDSRRAYH